MQKTLTPRLIAELNKACKRIDCDGGCFGIGYCDKCWKELERKDGECARKSKS